MTAPAAGWFALTSRDSAEQHRAATPLELLFDLTFVVAVAQAAAELHHALAAGDVRPASRGYVMVFFAIWWAWMNFTWFASAYDRDDVAYRLLTLCRSAARSSSPPASRRAFEHNDFRAVTVGYVVMRVALVVAVAARRRAVTRPRRAVALALRRRDHPRAARLAGPAAPAARTRRSLAAFLAARGRRARRARVGGARADATAWHPGHIAERYGLFTIIVLGESILAGTVTLQRAVTGGGLSASVAVVGVAAVVVVFCLWWVYFEDEVGDGLRRSPQESFRWGYAHFAVFAAVAAVGAGLQVAAEHVTSTVATDAAGSHGPLRGPRTVSVRRGRGCRWPSRSPWCWASSRCSTTGSRTFTSLRRCGWAPRSSSSRAASRPPSSRSRPRWRRPPSPASPSSCSRSSRAAGRNASTARRPRPPDSSTRAAGRRRGTEVLETVGAGCGGRHAMDILDAVADTYRRQGPLRQHVAVRSFLADAPAGAVQEQLATCLDAGVLVASGQGTVRLCDRLRVAVATRPVLAGWVQQARTAPQPLSGALTEGIREELRGLVRYCLTGRDEAQHRRAVELTAVLLYVAPSAFVHGRVIQVAGRYEHFRPDDDAEATTTWTGGMNYYAAAGHARLMADYLWVDAPGHAGTHQKVLAQVQVLF